MDVPRIVVGVDGSAGSARALRWAIDEARLRGAEVEAVHAWHWTYVGLEPYGGVAIDPATLEAAGQSVLDHAVDSVAVAGTGPVITRHLANGGAGAALVQAAKGADLLVVGARGHGGFVGLLLGSVSQQVAHHAHCAVVIVPDEE